MRTPAKRSRGNGGGTGASIPAPVGGWDAASALPEMKPIYAVKLDNMDPEPGAVKCRRGHIEHGTGVGAGPVESLMAYHGLTDAADRLFAASADTIFNVSSSGEGVSSKTGLNGGRFQHINMATAGGKFLVIANGIDPVQNWNGAAWSEPAITGITSSDVIHLAMHKRRLWMVLKESTKAAYLLPDSIAGAATVFDFGSIFTKGGYLMAAGSWTMDGGEGPDDLFVAYSSEGQVAVYQGSNPSQAATWSLVGVYDLPPPLGRRCMLKTGGDLAMVTKSGVMPLSMALKNDRAAADRVAITARIQNAMNSAARDYAGNFGWQLIGYANGTKAILNVPVSESLQSDQYVMNTLTGAWCRYTGMAAMCWEVFQDRLFFGGKGGKVFEADRGAMDDGQPIRCRMVTAFNYFGSRGQQKQFTMVQPLLVSDGRVTPAIEMNVDFDIVEPTAQVSEVQTQGDNWDEADWATDEQDGDALEWASDRVTITEWISVSGFGQCGAVHFSIDVAVPPALASNPVDLYVNGFNVLMKRGAFI